MNGLLMKYFVLKPKGVDVYAVASRAAMRLYARTVKAHNQELAQGLIEWADREFQGGDSMTEVFDIEAISSKVHEQWMESKRAKGVTTRKSETGEELMVPYGQLSEAAKDLDRGSVRAVIDAISAIRAAS